MLDSCELVVGQVAIVDVSLSNRFSQKPHVEQQVGFKPFGKSFKRLIHPESNQCAIHQLFKNSGGDGEQLGRMMFNGICLDFAADQVITAAVPAGSPAGDGAGLFRKISALLSPAIEIAASV